MSQAIWHTIHNHKDAPSTCGVYQYWEKDKILYIGKAINLKARLAGHAQNAKLDEKERNIVSSATEIRYTEVDSEFLALLLEAKLIREHMPPYNRIWKDDKTYLYIVINTKDAFPRPRFARAHELSFSTHDLTSKLKTFGPFPNTQVAEEVLRAIRRLIPFCMAKNIGKHACFYSKIGLCNPCPSNIQKLTLPECDIQKKQYRSQIRQVIKILEGNIDPVIKDFSNKMKVYSVNQDFEGALAIRNKIERFTKFVAHHSFRTSETISYNTSQTKIDSLKNILSTINYQLSSLNRIEFYDASNSGFHDSTVSMVVATSGLLDRGQFRRFSIKNPRINNDFDRLLEAMSRRLKNKTWDKPDLIVVDGGTPQLRKLQPIFDLLPTPIPYLGLAKRPNRLVTLEGQTLKVDPHMPGFQLLLELQGEAHRFANSYRRILENKRVNS